MAADPGGEPQRRASDRQGQKWQIGEALAQIVHRESLEIEEKRQRNVIHGDEVNRRPEAPRQRLPHTVDGEQRKKIGEDRRGPEDEKRFGRRRASDQAKIGHKTEVDGDCGGEGQAKVARMLFQRQKDAADERRQRASGIRWPKEKKGYPRAHHEPDVNVFMPRHGHGSQAYPERSAERRSHPNPGLLSNVGCRAGHRGDVTAWSGCTHAPKPIPFPRSGLQGKSGTTFAPLEPSAWDLNVIATKETSFFSPDSSRWQFVLLFATHALFLDRLLLLSPPLPQEEYCRHSGPRQYHAIARPSVLLQ